MDRTPPPSPEFVAIALLVSTALSQASRSQRREFLAALTAEIAMTRAAAHEGNGLEAAVQHGATWLETLTQRLSATFGGS